MNGRFALVCVPLFAVSFFIVVAIFRARGDKPVYRSFQMAGVSVLLWQLSCLAEFLAGEKLLRTACLINTSLAAYVAMGFLWLTVSFYGLGEYVSRRVMALVQVLPLTTLVIALSGDPFRLLYSRLEVVSLYPVYQVLCEPGAWYWGHIGFCCLMLGLALYHGLTQHLRLPRSFRECSSLMIVALVVVSGTVLFSLACPRDAALVLIMVGTCSALVTLYVAMKNNDRMNFLFMARSHIMDQLDTSILVLDHEGNVLDCNRAAREALELWTGKSEIDSLEGVLEQIREMGAQFQGAVEGERGMDVSISTNAVSRVYNVREELLPDRTGRMLGSVVVCTDVTHNRRLIHWLEETAGTDALTGLPNRGSLGLRRGEYESDAALPLSVIAGDVNGLKEINDTYGHFYGDQLLVAVGRALAASLPSEGTAFRIGGDEFVMVLPRTGPEEARSVQRAIERAMGQVEIRGFRPSIALGIATRSSQSLSLEEVIHQADQQMYRVKKSRRS